MIRPRQDSSQCWKTTMKSNRFCHNAFLFTFPSGQAPQYCQTHPQAVFPHAGNAAQYFDCSQPQSTLGAPYLQECTYPDLFRAQDLQCHHFDQVPPDTRPVPQAPCKWWFQNVRTLPQGILIATFFIEWTSISRFSLRLMKRSKFSPW